MKRPFHKLLLADHAASVVRTLHPHIKRKIKAAFQAILSDTSVGKALVDELSGLRSYRVSRFRVIYRVAPGKTIEIITVGPRDRIYEDTYRLVKKADKQSL
jgi:mRNA interferase RelE/StbE